MIFYMTSRATLTQNKLDHVDQTKLLLIQVGSTLRHA